MADYMATHPYVALRYVRAAEAGYAAAMYSAGVMHYQPPPGVKKSIDKALHWLTQVILNARIKNVVKSQSCMVSKLPILRRRRS